MSRRRCATEEGRQFITVSANVRASPKFPADRYRRWRGEILFWWEIRPYSTEESLVAELTLGSEGVLHAIMAKFLKDNSAEPQ